MPTVLFVCVHNAGRSQMAAGFLQHLAGGRVDVRSAGSEPAEQLNPVVVAAMLEEGIDIRNEQPARLSTDAVRAADVVITMGCGDACPVFPGKRYEDWELTDPAGARPRRRPADPRRRARAGAGPARWAGDLLTGGDPASQDARFRRARSLIAVMTAVFASA